MEGVDQRSKCRPRAFPWSLCRASQERVRAGTVVGINRDRIRETSPAEDGRCQQINGGVEKGTTSHARHWIIVSDSVLGSYGLAQRQKRPRKFCPY